MSPQPHEPQHRRDATGEDAAGTPSPPRRRRGRWLQHWWITLILAAAIGADVVFIARQSRERGAAGPGWLGMVTWIWPWPGTRGPVRYPDVFVVREPADPAEAGAGASARSGDSGGQGVLRVIDPEAESWLELGALLEKHHERLIRASFEVSVGRSGFWALTREERSAVIELEPLEPGAFTDAELAEARRLVAPVFASVDGRAFAELAARARDRDFAQRRVMWGGYLHNIVFLAAIAALVWSLAWIPRTIASIRAWRGRRRAARGRCPGCGYSTQGLIDGRCPECGTELGGV